MRRDGLEAPGGERAARAEIPERPGEGLGARRGGRGRSRPGRRPREPQRRDRRVGPRTGGLGREDAATVRLAHEQPERRGGAAADVGGHALIPVEEARELDAAVGERALVDRDDRGVVDGRGDGEAADVGIEGVQRRRRGGAHAAETGRDRAGGVGLQPRRGQAGAADALRNGEELEQHGVGQAALAHRQPLVEAQPAVEHPLRPRPPPARRLQPPRLRDPDQRQLREPELLRLVPALEPEAGVPVEVAAVGPVAGDRSPLPAPDEAAARARERDHAGAPRLVVEAQEREHDVRVLGGVEVGAGVGREVRQVLEAHAGAEVAPPDEAGELPAQVAPQQARAAGHRRVGGVHQRVPVDLVEADRRPAKEARGRDAVDAVRDLRRRLVGQPERAARLPGVHEPVDDLGVEHEVLARVGAPHRARPSRRVRLGARPGVGGRALDEHRRRHQRACDQPRAVVVAGGPGVALLRGDAVGQQQQRVDERVDAAGARPVLAALLVPERVEALLHAVGVGEVARVVVGERGGRRAGREQQHGEQQGTAKRSPTRARADARTGMHVSLLARREVDGAPGPAGCSRPRG